MSQKKLAIVTPKMGVHSETFIAAHAQCHGGNTVFFHAFENGYPSRVGANEVLLGDWKKAIGRIQSKFGRARFTEYADAIARSFRKNKVGAVLAEYGTSACMIQHICKKMNIPLLVHFHGRDAFNREVVSRNIENYRLFFEYATSIIVVSEWMKKKLVELGAPSEKLVMNPYGANDSFFRVNPNRLSCRFLAVGRFTDKKAPYYTILAFNKVREKCPGARLTFLGEGTLLESCRNLSQYLNLTESIEFGGRAEHQDVVKAMEKSFCFVQHSIEAENGDSEGAPVAIIEASAASLPVISTKHSGIVDIVTDGQTGLLVSEHAVDEMAKHMITLYQDRTYAQKLGENARDVASRCFTMEKHIGILDELTMNCINDS